MAETECRCCSDLLGTDVHLRDRCTACIANEIQRVMDVQNVTQSQAADVIERRRRFIEQRYQPVIQ